MRVRATLTLTVWYDDIESQKKAEEALEGTVRRGGMIDGDIYGVVDHYTMKIETMKIETEETQEA
jgi:hypothetical protein